ncbi:hypothetical protein [Saccharopolyspora mangrovi]|uniref:Uncharacterized protein n=1 Tax=Saccharopolyspora mangrovi TaxID=3082379 RepID=A0ABU6A8K2_9PSEU|nr:hypothetical protein [Saccharopolyspora sp. S2-29]MEB3367828.1 hypothetical protein [Saccharopolyspora sp. S2-29]
MAEEEHSECRGCSGTGNIKVARRFMALDTGEVSTVMALARCPYCRETPGRQRGGGPPV